MTKIIKVDRVKSISEAKELEELGVNLISVSLSKDYRFNDDRVLDFQTAISIRESLQAAKCAGELSLDEISFNPIPLITEIGFDYVQLTCRKVPSLDFINHLKMQGIKTICTGISASHDDDPSWILSRFLEQEYLQSIYFQVDLLPEYKDAWEFLKNESPDYPEELQIEDINQLAEKYDLLIALNYSIDNILEVIRDLPNTKGISMVLGRSLIDDIHCYDYLKVVEVLQGVRSSIL